MKKKKKLWEERTKEKGSTSGNLIELDVDRARTREDEVDHLVKLQWIERREPLYEVLSFEDSLALAFELMGAANKYMLPRLIELCEAWMMQYKQLVLENTDLCELFIFADAHQTLKLRAECLQAMVPQYRKLLESELWPDVPVPIKMHLESEYETLREKQEAERVAKNAKRERERLRLERARAEEHTNEEVPESRTEREKYWWSMREEVEASGAVSRASPKAESTSTDTNKKRAKKWWFF